MAAAVYLVTTTADKLSFVFLPTIRQKVEVVSIFRLNWRKRDLQNWAIWEI